MLKLNLYNVTGCHNCPLLSFKYSSNSPIIDHKCYLTDEVITSDVHNRTFHEDCPGTYVDINEILSNVLEPQKSHDLEQKIRPVAKIVNCSDEDGHRTWDKIIYQCPTCGKVIHNGYQGETGCDACKTFFDWGNTKPTIEVSKTINW